MQTFIKEIEKWLQEGGLVGWLIALALTFLLTLGVKLILSFIVPRFEKFTEHTKTIWDDALAKCLEKIKVWVVFVTLLMPLVHIVSKNQDLHKVSKALMILALTYQAIVWIRVIITQWRDKVLSKKIEKDASSASAISLMITALQSAFILLFVLIALSNLGIDVNAFIASLGIGGIAIALAVQSILGDLFSSLSIVLDKPFVVGDYITVGDDSGTVEKIGIKTTRVRAISGEQLIFANKDLLENRIHNYKRMYSRRVEKRLTFVRNKVGTSDLPLISEWVKEYLKQVDKIDLDYCNMVAYDIDFVVFELVYFVKDPAYNFFIKTQEEFLLAVMKRFADYQVSVLSPKDAPRQLVSLLPHHVHQSFKEENAHETPQ